MADSKFRNPDADSDEDLVQCGICFAVIDNPKALPCLHTFCEKCLSKWAESSAKKQPDKYTDVVSCPACREEFPLPPGGAKNLKTNFFVNKLKERKSIQRKLHAKDAKIPCTSCTDASNQGAAVARCVECNDFLCDSCVEVHKSVRVLRRHELLTLDELRSGKLGIHNLPEQEGCPKHKGEILRFYCETCDEPMCRDCTVVDHPRPDHKQVDLESAAGERTENLKKLAKECEPLAKKLDNAIKKDEEIMNNLEAALETAVTAIEQSTDAAVTNVLEALKKAGATKKNELQQLGAKRKKEIECHRESLDLMRIRIHTALEMTHQVTEKGSAHDVATMYSSLTNTMKQLCNVEPTAIRKSLAKVEFKPNDELVKGELGEIGTLKKDVQWVLKKRFPQGQFTYPRCISLSVVGDNDAVVTDFNSGNPYVGVIGHDDGQLKLSIRTSGLEEVDYTGCSQPWGLATGKDGQYFVTDLTSYVKVFNAQGAFKHRFGAVDSNGRSFLNNESALYGLAIDRRGRLFVGSYDSYYMHISIHNQDGSHVSSFAVKLLPYFLAFTSNDNLIVSDHCRHVLGVHIYDYTGNHLHTFTAPEGAGTWYPTGICCASDEVYVASQRSPTAAIYRYSMTGEYLGVVTKEVTEPWGIALKDDDDKLLVVDQNVIKVFQLE